MSPGKGLAAGRFACQQRKLAMGRGVLGEVIDDDQRMAALVTKIFADGEAGEGRDPLQRGRRGRRGDDEHASVRRAILLHGFDHPLDRGRALPDRDIDADHVGPLLVDDRIDCDRRLADGAVADDELALAAPEGKQRIDHEHAGRDRFGDERTVDDRRRRPFDRMVGLGVDRLVPVERTPKGSITRPSSPWPTGTRATSPVAETSEPTPTASASSKMAALTACASSDSA